MGLCALVRPPGRDELAGGRSGEAPSATALSLGDTKTWVSSESLRGSQVGSA